VGKEEIAFYGQRCPERQEHTDSEDHGALARAFQPDQLVTFIFVVAPFEGGDDHVSDDLQDDQKFDRGGETKNLRRLDVGAFSRSHPGAIASKHHGEAGEQQPQTLLSK